MCASVCAAGITLQIIYSVASQHFDLHFLHFNHSPICSSRCTAVLALQLNSERTRIHLNSLKRRFFVKHEHEAERYAGCQTQHNKEKAPPVPKTRDGIMYHSSENIKMVTSGQTEARITKEAFSRVGRKQRNQKTNRSEYKQGKI